MWTTLIVEGFTGGNQKADDHSCAELTAALMTLSLAGWAIRFVLPNGVNRWTVIAERMQA